MRRRVAHGIWALDRACSHSCEQLCQLFCQRHITAFHYDFCNAIAEAFALRSLRQCSEAGHAVGRVASFECRQQKIQGMFVATSAERLKNFAAMGDWLGLLKDIDQRIGGA